MWHAYIVKCADQSLYTGIAKDLDARIGQHNAGKGSAYTRSRRPVELVHSELADDRSSAQRREAAIKRLPVSLKRSLIQAGS